MGKNRREAIVYHQKTTSQGRKKWRRITRRQQEWMLKALSRLYVEEVKNTHEVLKSAKCKKIIDVLFEMLRERRIFISKGEVSRLADYKMRKRNKNMRRESAHRMEHFLDSL